MVNKKIKDAKKYAISVNLLTHYPEKLLNFMWKNHVKVKNFKRQSFVEIYFEIDNDNFHFVEEFCAETGSKIERVNTISWQRIFTFLREQFVVILISLFCLSIFLYFENFVWKINIKTVSIVSPLEIRKILYENNIVEGMPKNLVKFREIEDILIKSNENILWCKARVVGGILNIEIEEKIPPPEIAEVEEKYEIRAIKDGVVERVYSTKGIVTVTKGDTIKKGDLLIQTTGNGAEGDVFARVFYESESAYPLKEKRKEYTGSSMTNLTLNLFNKEFKIKNSDLKYDKYDKIETNIVFLNITKYYEYKDNLVDLNEDKVIEYAKKELTYKIIRNCDRAIEINDIVIDKKQMNDTLVVKLLLIGIENIAEK